MEVRPIRNDADHEKVLREIEQYWNAALIATAPRAPAEAVRDAFGFSGYGD